MGPQRTGSQGRRGKEGGGGVGGVVGGVGGGRRRGGGGGMINKYDHKTKSLSLSGSDRHVCWLRVAMSAG